MAKQSAIEQDGVIAVSYTHLNNIARQVEGKIAYRRTIKMAIANTMRMGAEGIKIQISGRLNGACLLYTSRCV